MPFETKIAIEEIRITAPTYSVSPHIKGYDGSPIYVGQGGPNFFFKKCIPFQQKRGKNADLVRRR